MSTARCEPLTLAGLAWPVELHLHPRARVMRLRLDERRQLLRLTAPARASRRAAYAWAAAQAEWVDRQMARIAPAQSLVPGTILSVDGEELVLEWRAGAARGVVRDQRRLISGGPREGFERRIARWLKREALEVLSRDTAAIAALAGVTVRAVAVGDAATRWGSCSASGRIRYNMRLLLLPPEVRRYVVAHEVAHRVHMDHGAAFHALEADLFGGPVGPARLALRRLGPGLKRIDLAS